MMLQYFDHIPFIDEMPNRYGDRSSMMLQYFDHIPFIDEMPNRYGDKFFYSEKFDKYVYALFRPQLFPMHDYFYITKECYLRISEGGRKNWSPDRPEIKEEEILFRAAADTPRFYAFYVTRRDLDEPFLYHSYLYCKENGRFYFHVFHNGRHYAIAPGAVYFASEDVVYAVIGGVEKKLGRGFEVSSFEGMEEWQKAYDLAKAQDLG